MLPSTLIRSLDQSLAESAGDTDEFPEESEQLASLTNEVAISASHRADTSLKS